MGALSLMQCHEHRKARNSRTHSSISQQRTHLMTHTFDM
jgi:hypothetical protein